MYGYTPHLFPSILMSPSLVRVFAVPLFFLTFLSLFLWVASIFTEELYVIFLALSRISVRESNNFVTYYDSRSLLQALGRVYTRNSLVLKIQRFLCDLHARRKFVSFCWIPSNVGLSGKEKDDALAKRAIQLPPANHNALHLHDYVPLFAFPSVPPGSPVGTCVLRMVKSWLSWNLPFAHCLLVPSCIAT